MKFSCMTPEVGIWCAVSAHKIMGPMSLEEAVNSVYYVHFNHTHFILDFAKGEKCMVTSCRTMQQISQWLYQKGCKANS